jgi:hypothetical protein
MQADSAGDGSVSALTAVVSTPPAVVSDISTFKEESQQNGSTSTFETAPRTNIDNAGILGSNFENQVRSFSALLSSNLKRTDFIKLLSAGEYGYAESRESIFSIQYVEPKALHRHSKCNTSRQQKKRSRIHMPIQGSRC